MGESELEVGVLRQLDAKEIDSVLRRQGFDLFEVYTPRETRTIFKGHKKPHVVKHTLGPSKMGPEGRIRLRKYVFCDKSDESESYVRIVYRDALYTDTHWRKINTAVVAEFGVATGSDVYTNDVCRAKQGEVARFLRDHYGGTLYDPQIGKVIK